VNDACYALHTIVLAAAQLEVVTTVLHVQDPMVGCLCTATMVAIPLFPIRDFYFRALGSLVVLSFP
jgi:hypothetical protein